MTTDDAIGKLPSPLRTPEVARAMFSPSAILLAGGGAALAILSGAWVLAPFAAIAAWGARVAVAAPWGRGKRPAINPGKLPEPWRGFVLDAARARKRFDELVRRVPAGPLRDELESIAGRVADGVTEAQEVARKGVLVDQARASLQLGQAAAELDRLRGERSLRVQQGMDVASLDQAIRATQRQLEAGQRVENVAFQTRDRLRVLNAQLDEATAAVIELTVRPGATSAGQLSGQVEGIVDQLSSLRVALDEASAITPTSDVSSSPTLEAR
jgi:hypothetical protein